MFKSIFSLLQLRDFRNLWIGQAISRLGDSFYFIGPMFVVKQLYNDDRMVGLVGACDTLPYLLLSPLAGALADRVDRKKILLWSDIISGLILLIYLAVIFQVSSNPAVKPPKEMFLVVAFLLSSTRVFFFPAKNACIPRLVPQEKLLAANSFSSATDQFMWLGGNALVAGLGFISEKYGVIPFLEIMVIANALSFLVSAVFIAPLPSVVPERKDEGSTDIMEDIREGLTYARKDKVIGLTLIAQVGISLFISPFFVVYLATNKEWFRNKAADLAAIEACFIIGMLVTSIIVTARHIRRPGMAYSLGILACGFAVGVMGFSNNFYLYCFWNLIAGIAIGIVDSPMMTYLQVRVPDAYRGRVMSLKNLIMMGIQPIGMVVGGTLLKALGIMKMHALMGAGFGVSGVLPILDKEFRNVELEKPVEQEPLKPVESE